ncbi:MAG: zf-HC2 domain-containing protein [Myxococcota bacterium]
MKLHCDEMPFVVPLYLDDELAARERAEVENHLDRCASCRRDASRELSFLAALRLRLRPPPPAPHLRTAIVRALATARPR